MAPWKLGYWTSYKEGEIHQTMKKCIKLLLRDKFKIGANLLTQKKLIKNEKGLLEALKAYEKKHGVNKLLEIFNDRLRLNCTRKDAKLEVDIILRMPTSSKENEETFKNMVIEWVETNSLTYAERFFRLPKITEDFSDRYLDNPLETALKNLYGYDFEYRILIKCKKVFPEHQELRKELHAILHGNYREKVRLKGILKGAIKSKLLKGR